MPPEETRQPGLLESVQQLMATALGLVRNRLELLVVELQEEKARFTQMAAFLAFAGACGFLGMIALGAGFAALLWESCGVLAIFIVAAGYFAAGGFCWYQLRRRLRHEPPLAATLEELRKDRECLKGER